MFETGLREDYASLKKKKKGAPPQGPEMFLFCFLPDVGKTMRARTSWGVHQNHSERSLESSPLGA